MRKRRAVLISVAAAVLLSAAVTFVVFAVGKTDAACGCSVVPDVRGPAQDAAVRFEGLVRRGDVGGAWAMLSDEAKARYVDPAGLRPVLDRLGASLAGSDARWLAVDEKVRYDQPSEVVVVRNETAPLLVLVPLGHVGEERIDPGVPPLQLTAEGDGDGVRVELPDGDPDRTRFVVIDEAEQIMLPSRQQLTERAERLTWRAPRRGPVVVIGIERTDSGPRVGVATVNG
ncbi:hypothetical protein [Dactylosporangium sp. CS-033363]|uniref:hypothetical protein n=1 Tax=Dactylosporangium sp. CS-033363 TaxID=3239935 RepID=UPI003D90A8A2